MSFFNSNQDTILKELQTIKDTLTDIQIDLDTLKELQSKTDNNPSKEGIAPEQSQSQVTVPEIPKLTNNTVKAITDYPYVLTNTKSFEHKGFTSYKAIANYLNKSTSWVFQATKENRIIDDTYIITITDKNIEKEKATNNPTDKKLSYLVYDNLNNKETVYYSYMDIVASIGISKGSIARTIKKKLLYKGRYTITRIKDGKRSNQQENEPQTFEHNMMIIE